VNLFTSLLGRSVTFEDASYTTSVPWQIVAVFLSGTTMWFLLDRHLPNTDCKLTQKLATDCTLVPVKSVGVTSHLVPTPDPVE
jgi:hypothetical protein